MKLTAQELSSLWHTAMIHQRFCDNEGDATIEQVPGGGIGTVTYLICGCGNKFDITDYDCW